MTWIVPASEVLLLVAVAAGLWMLLRRRAERAAANAEPQQSRVMQFLTTGTMRASRPRGSVSDLRLELQALVERAENSDNQQMLAAYLADVRDLCGADEAVYWLWNAENDRLVPEAWSTEHLRPQHFDMASWASLVRWAAEGRVVHFDADARAAVARLAAAPVEHENELIGVLSVSRASGLDRGREYLKEWLPRHAAQVRRLVQSFDLRRELSRNGRQSQALLSAAQRMQQHKTQEALCKVICDTALQVTSASEAGILRWRADVGRGWVLYATEGLPQGAPFPLTAEALTTQTCSDGVAMFVEDASQMKGPPALFYEGDGGWPAGSFAIVPLKLEERVIGAIVVASRRAEGIPKDELRNVALLGAVSATSLEMVWEMEEVSRRASTDALTSLANRRAFDEHLGQLVAQADRFGHPVSLIIADVDHFKDVNDTFGHDSGDAVLRMIATTLREGVREVDVCARYGGEEFAMLLPQTTLQGAGELAERLRRAVESRSVRAAKTTALGRGDLEESESDDALEPLPARAEIRVTISCGVACYPETGLTKDALFAAADRALYDAKGAGRNCVRSAVPKSIGVVR